MAEPKSDDANEKHAPHSENVTTRVNVAFPFSQIKVAAPTEDLVALAALVRDLADALADAAPGPRAEELKERAQALATRLQ